MLALIRGEVLRLTDHGVIVLAGGLGYDLQTTPATRGQLALGASVELVIYEHIREDCHQLYGFLESSAKELFELLLTVSGVGPRLALAVLEVGPETELRAAINASQVDYLIRASGLGRRLADRLILDLKDKVGPAGGSDPQTLSPAGLDEATAALIGLGLSLDEAQQALVGIDPGLPTASRVQQALGGLNVNVA